jgi:hypothetical protein
VVGFVPDIVDRESARKFESVIERDAFGSGIILDDGLLHGAASLRASIRHSCSFAVSTPMLNHLLSAICYLSFAKRLIRKKPSLQLANSQLLLHYTNSEVRC